MISPTKRGKTWSGPEERSNIKCSCGGLSAIVSTLQTDFSDPVDHCRNSGQGTFSLHGVLGFRREKECPHHER
jgi:hypothetical protein